jgi:hypothetical protein
MTSKKSLKVGQWVEVRSKDEILRTLDRMGQLEEMPFMPEMFAFVGKRFRVLKSAHKTCDYSTPYPFHTCLLYWKEDWLKPVGEREDSAVPEVPFSTNSGGNGKPLANCTENDIRDRVKAAAADGEGPKYTCQMTQIPFATTPLAWWDPSQYLEDYLSGNVSLGRIISGLIFWTYYSISEAGIGVGRPMRWLYDRVVPIFGGSLFPRKPGVIPEGQLTPTQTLNLQPGELIRIKSHEEILQTIDSSNRNRGMHWDAELVPYCGKTFKVRDRVTKIIGERTQKMVQMKTPCIVLESVVCQARYSSCRLFCPKEMYPYWREIWLERVRTDEDSSSVDHSSETLSKVRTAE